MKISSFNLIMFNVSHEQERYYDHEPYYHHHWLMQRRQRIEDAKSMMWNISCAVHTDDKKEDILDIILVPVASVH
eukprot:scaffold294590_cov22-Prasinocladus_malaysianus.AAC.1